MTASSISHRLFQKKTIREALVSRCGAPQVDVCTFGDRKNALVQQEHRCVQVWVGVVEGGEDSADGHLLPPGSLIIQWRFGDGGRENGSSPRVLPTIGR